MLLDGIHIPATTPFYPDGRLNLRKLEHNIDRYSRTPAAGILLLGPNGEARTLNDRETQQGLEAAIALAAPEKVMLAGVARDGVASALDVIEQAARLGYDAAVLTLPGIFGSCTGAFDRHAITWFQEIADRAALPLVLTSSPSAELSLNVIGELAAHRRLLGIIEASEDARRIPAIRQRTDSVRRTATVTTVFAAVTGRMLAPPPRAGSLIGVESLREGGTSVAVAAPVTAPPIRTRTRETGFQVLTGSAAGMLGALRDGASGAIPRLAACSPQACFEVFAAWKDGDNELADGKQHRLLAAAAHTETEFAVPFLKYACDLNGYFGGISRLPLLGLSSDDKRRAEETIRAIPN